MADEPSSFAEFLDDYYAECDEHLLAIRSDLLRLESDTGVDRDVVEDLFRRFHTIKGLSSMVGLREAEELAHEMEAGLRPLRGSAGRPPALEATALRALIDGARLLEQVIAARRQGEQPPATAPGVEHAAAALAAPDAPPGLPADDDERARLDAALAQGGSAWWFEFVPSAERAARGVNVTTVRERLLDIGSLIRAAPSVAPDGTISFEFLLVSRAEPETIVALCGEDVSCHPYQDVAAAAEPDAAPDVLRADPQARQRPGLLPANVVRVDLARLDELMQTVGRLIVGGERLDQAMEPIERLLPGAAWRAVEDAKQAIERDIRGLRDQVVRVRLVPIGELFERMRFLARDLARESHKRVRVDIEGQSTQMDKLIVEQMMDPLLHLVRNAVVHGLEEPAGRRDRGKPPEGRLGLRASTVGDRVVIEIEDDGRGIDVQAVGRQARALGALRPGEEIEPDGLLSVLSTPGLTTRAEADLTSGRGTGLAVVRDRVQALGGTVALDTTPGRGTRFAIELPLTLLIIDALLVGAGGQAYAVPQAAVHECVEVSPGAITAVDGGGAGHEVIAYRDGVAPLLRLAAEMGLQAGPAGGMRQGYALMVGAKAQPSALLVDRLLGQRQIVVRPLADPLLRAPGVAGAAELGSGQVILILDPTAVVARQKRRRRQIGEGATARSTRPDRGTRQEGDRPVSGSQAQAEPFILFRLAETTYAVRSRDVQHVEMLGQVAPVPDAPPFLDGVVLARGQMIPAVNLRVRFGFDRVPYDLRTRLIVVHTAGRTVGLVADTAREFVRIAADAIQPPPEPIAGLAGNWVEGIAAIDDRLVIVLNIDEVISLADAVQPAGPREVENHEV